MRYYEETIGLKFGRLIVLDDLGSNRVLVRCDCGVEKRVDRRAMRAGRIRSCGCLSREKTSNRMTTHGLSNSRFMSIWKGMKRRCYDPDGKGWPWYGGKGIKVCERWHSFENFAIDMLNAYDDSKFIDRIDNDKDYCKENCRWISHAEQFPTKITIEQVNAIIEDPRTQAEIADDYGVSHSYVSMLKSGVRRRRAETP